MRHLHVEKPSGMLCAFEGGARGGARVIAREDIEYKKYKILKNSPSTHPFCMLKKSDDPSGCPGHIRFLTRGAQVNLVRGKRTSCTLHSDTLRAQGEDASSTAERTCSVFV